MKRSSLSPVVLLVLICVFAVGHIWWLSFICDDAFISFRYARNLVEGNGLVFNVGERVEGYTNFLWVLVSALIIDAGAKPEVWTLWIGGFCALLTLIAVMLYQYQRGRDFVFVGILVAANGGFAAWATGGLETSLFTLLVTLGVLSLAARFDPPPAQEDAHDAAAISSGWRTQWLILSAGFLFLAALTRPEGVLVTGLCGVFLLTQVIGRKLPWRELFLWAVIWIVPYAVYFGWRYQYYGHLFPNTYYVKSRGPVLWISGLDYLFNALQRLHVYLLLIPGVALLFARRSWGMPQTLKRLLAIVTIPYLFYVVYVGGDFMDMFRFLVPIIPIALIAVGSSWYAYFTFVRSKWSVNAALTIAGVLLVAAVGLNLYTSWDAQQVWYRHRLDSIGLLRRYADDWKLAARYLRQVGRPTDSLATTAAGIIPYYTGMYTIDQLGLISPDLDQYTVRDVNRPGHILLAKGEYLFGLAPQFIIGHPKVTDDPNTARPSTYVEDDWFDELKARYIPVMGTLSESPPRYMTFGMRKDLQADTLGVD